MACYRIPCLILCLIVTVCKAAKELKFGAIKEPMSVSCGYNNTDPVIIRYQGDIVGLFANDNCKSENLAAGIYRLIIVDKALCKMTRFHGYDTWVVSIFIQTVDAKLIIFGDTEYSITCDYSEQGEGVSNVVRVVGQPAGGISDDGFEDDGFDDGNDDDYEKAKLELHIEDSLGNHLTHVKLGQEVRIRVTDTSPMSGCSKSTSSRTSLECEEDDAAFIISEVLIVHDFTDSFNRTREDTCSGDDGGQGETALCLEDDNATRTLNIDCTILERGVFHKCNYIIEPDTFISKCSRVAEICTTCTCDPDAAWKTVCETLNEYVCQCEIEGNVHIDWLPYHRCSNKKKRLQIKTCIAIQVKNEADPADVKPIFDWCGADDGQSASLGSELTFLTPYVPITYSEHEYVYFNCIVYHLDCANTTLCPQNCSDEFNGTVSIKRTDRIHIHPANTVGTGSPSDDETDDLSDATSYDVNKDRKPVMLDNCSVTSPSVLPYLIVIIILAIATLALIIAIIFLVRRLRARETTGCAVDPQPYIPTWPPRQDPRKYDVRFAHGRPSTYRGESSSTQTAGPRQRSYYSTSAPSPPRETESVTESEIEDPLERMRIQLEGILPSTSGVLAPAPLAPTAPPMPSIGPQASSKSLTTFESEAGPSRPDTSETSIKL